MKQGSRAFTVKSPISNRKLVNQLLSWYDHAARELPWRTKGDIRANPYHVWISEIMLQQTRVSSVIPYFKHFTTRWPTIADLAEAKLDEILHGWQGLGYYRRAHMLHKCARLIVADYGGSFPPDESTLRTLPGVGPYTAAAIAAIAFGRHATVVDGNVERVIARLRAVEEPLPRSKRLLRRLAGELTPSHCAGDYAQAVMDLGATICIPRAPRCNECPWSTGCLAHAGGFEGDLPRRIGKRKKRLLHAVGFWLQRDDGAILFQRRPNGELLGGMMAVPMTTWKNEPWLFDEACDVAPIVADWNPVESSIQYKFTHFDCKILMLIAYTQSKLNPFHNSEWRKLHELPSLALPTLTKRLVNHIVQFQGAIC